MVRKRLAMSKAVMDVSMFPPRHVNELTDLIDGVRTAVTARADWAETAQLVAGQLRAHLPGPYVLTAEQRLGPPDDYCCHVLYVEPDGRVTRRT
jgi:hypothetical protein